MIAIERDHRLAFGYGLGGSALRTKYLAFGKMCKWAAR
jgi:hypothetical protein